MTFSEPNEKLIESEPAIRTFKALAFALMLIQILLVILSLLLPWGKTMDGTDIRSRAEGLLPWFLIVPLVIQLGMLKVRQGALRNIYLALALVIAFLSIGVHSISLIRYSQRISGGFYILFPLCVISLISSFLFWRYGAVRR